MVGGQDNGSAERCDSVGTLLATARRSSGLRQKEVVERTSLSQAQLSRIERGSAMPSVEQARELAALYRLGSAARSRVVDAAADHEAGRSDSRLVIQRGNILSLQQRFRRIEESAVLVRAFSPTMILGQLQTPAYVAAVFNEPPDAPVVRDRLRRAVDSPANRHRVHTLILAEGALRWPLGSPSVMAEQLAHLVTVSELPNVHLGLISSRGTVDVGPGPAFYLYDDHTVVLSEVGGFALLNNRSDLNGYRGTFEHLEQLAVFGPNMRAQLREIAAEYRDRQSSTSNHAGREEDHII